ncbi:glycosyltransferase [Dysgonomonas sp. BGC7]|uniref:glycosyltransferase n=1 Tax=Dysgonomonas sp. BGC7 TaxID=1658008 RepID=UPI000682538B|nr:glycosyltransferase [Dysgonomonas sp. BGC7]MBD8389763.1 glycosyltransferase [Dysgonomonas sp. BGC7]
MKILRVISSMDPKGGGPCQGIRNSISEFKRRGIDNDVLCFDSSDVEYLGTDDFTIYTIGPSTGPYAYCPDLKRWLLDNILKYDVVIIHGLWLYHSYGTYKVWNNLKKSGVKVPRLYVMPHGMLDPYFQKAKGRKLKAIRNWLFWKLIENRVVNNVDGILFTCKEELLLAREPFFPYKPKRELNIGYGVLPPPEYNTEMGNVFFEKCIHWNKKPLWLFLSRIHEKKGVDILIKAYLKLKLENNELPQLIVAGPGLGTNFGKEIQKIAKNNMDILFPGMLAGDSKWGAFYNCEAFILPSHQENFGIAIVEAMACAKPVLITNKVNIWREIKAGEGGFIGFDTEESVYEMLKDWLSLSSQKKIEIGENAQNTYVQSFSIKEMADKMINVFKDA